jgi:hypothetical protein
MTGAVWGQIRTLSGDFLTMLVVHPNFYHRLAEPLFVRVLGGWAGIRTLGDG